MSLYYNNLCCGLFVPDLSVLKERLPESIQKFIPSDDTVEYCAQELKTKNIEIALNSIIISTF